MVARMIGTPPIYLSASGVSYNIRAAAVWRRARSKRLKLPDNLPDEPE